MVIVEMVTVTIEVVEVRLPFQELTDQMCFNFSLVFILSAFDQKRQVKEKKFSLTQYLLFCIFNCHAFYKKKLLKYCYFV